MPGIGEALGHLRRLVRPDRKTAIVPPAAADKQGAATADIASGLSDRSIRVAVLGAQRGDPESPGTHGSASDRRVSALGRPVRGEHMERRSGQDRRRVGDRRFRRTRWTGPERRHRDRRRDVTSCWERYVSLSRHQPEGGISYRVRPRMMRDNRPPPYSSRVEPVQPVRSGNGATGSVPNYYALLGVERSATLEHLEQVYRRHVAVLHPDKFSQEPPRRDLAQEKLKELNGAMKVLRDPEQRARYDSLLSGDVLPGMPILSRMRRTGRT